MTRIIGITGGIASGKSTVTAYLRQKGYVVIDADALVHDLQRKGGKLYTALVTQFGEEVLTAEGVLDRPKLAKRIFSSKESRALSNRLQNEIIRTALHQQKELVSQSESLFFMDIPLLIEQDYQGWFDGIWLVTVEESEQCRRLMARNQLSLEEAEQRLASQLSLAEKRPFATDIIDNQGSRQATYAQVDHLLSTLEKRLNES